MKSIPSRPLLVGVRHVHADELDVVSPGREALPPLLWEQMSRANRVRLVTSKSSVCSVRSPFVRRLLSVASRGPRQARFCLTLIRSPRNLAAPARYSPSSEVPSKSRARGASVLPHSPGTGHPVLSKSRASRRAFASPALPEIVLRRDGLLRGLLRLAVGLLLRLGRLEHRLVGAEALERPAVLLGERHVLRRRVHEKRSHRHA